MYRIILERPWLFTVVVVLVLLTIKVILSATFMAAINSIGILCMVLALLWLVGAFD